MMVLCFDTSSSAWPSAIIRLQRKIGKSFCDEVWPELMWKGTNYIIIRRSNSNSCRPSKNPKRRIKDEGNECAAIAAARVQSCTTRHHTPSTHSMLKLHPIYTNYIGQCLNNTEKIHYSPILFSLAGAVFYYHSFVCCVCVHSYT